MKSTELVRILVKISSETLTLQESLNYGNITPERLKERVEEMIQDYLGVVISVEA